MLNCCSSSSQAQPYTPAEKVIIASTTVLIASVVALNILFFLANPLTHPQSMAYLYADCAIGGVALLSLVVSSIVKCRGGSQSVSEKSASRTKVRELKYTPSVSKKELLSADERKRIQLEVSSNLARVKRKENFGDFNFLLRHQTTPIFALKGFPDLSFRLMSVVEAMDELGKVKPPEEGMTPQATLILLESEGESLFVRKTKENQPEESSENPLDLLYELDLNGYSETEKNRWKEQFEKAAFFICRTGFQFPSLQNLEWMEDTCDLVSGTFSKVDPNNRIAGIVNLLQIAPPECVQCIFDMAEKHQITTQSILSKLKVSSIDVFTACRKNDIQLHKDFHNTYRERRITKKEPKIDPTPWKEGTIEREIIDHYNDTRHSDFYGPIIEQRQCTWQPFLRTQQNQIVAKKYQYTNALENLHAQGIVLNWGEGVRKKAQHLVFDIQF